ncbi:Alpha-1,2-mannosyltransferase [Wickerhamomyces ciferrii]|uniref:Alpha-1,2-mannosyltransferase n=1 Tax=Wickerhamomyces ciferrii (strain ATCC 14091 / BCRC 22168 / CBS 111 / JCM 3599 / NBRC 0793 / NRRL Y-1031 F-60-10) TaxID=1206466 RepID=K0KSX9_WICCF|nr:Alpha-1,2-mannosyltransferase [Wickerhamomyces ciferrii]CCH44484.1 Alpha-1,2-mannosyltransferase [Wickerhamomyces ciferrii]
MRISPKQLRTGFILLVTITITSVLMFHHYDDVSEITQGLNNTWKDTNFTSITSNLKIPSSKEFNDHLEVVVTSDKPEPQIKISNKHELFTTVYDIINQHDPKLPHFNKFKSGSRIPTLRANKDKPIFTKEFLSQFITIDDDQIQHMQTLHSSIITQFGNLSTTKEVYKGTGIVYVGGGRFNWFALMSIKTLRNLGSQLPIEVLIPNMGDYEEEFCTKTLPSLNAECNYLPDLLGEDLINYFKIGGYQYKSLAILTSSFENMLLLDADNLPISIPDRLFDSDVFHEKGLVSWPDFWRRSTSPNFYEIAGLKIQNLTKSGNPVNEETSLHQLQNTLTDPTSESGQLLINKTQHFQTMLLSLYYNIFGPQYFYPLLSQGAVGEGDKETFVAAALASQLSYHQVGRSVHAIGRHKKDGHFVGVAMGQFDPEQDYANHLNGKELKGPKMMFVHANYFKLHPEILRRQNALFEGSQRIRMFGPMKGFTGYDFELFQFKNMEFLICEFGVKMNTFKNENITQICDELGDHIQFLERTQA